MTEIRVLVGTVDFEDSSAFYGDLLGFSVAETWGDVGGRGTLFQAASGGVIEIFEDSLHHPFEQPAGVKVAVEVADVDALYRRLIAAGLDIVDPIGDRSWGLRSFEVHDPSGFPLVFFTSSDATGHEG